MSSEETKRRELKNLLINPGAQFRLFVPHLATLFLFGILFNFMTYHNADVLGATLVSASHDQATALNHFFTQMVWSTAITLIIACTLGGILTLITTHRIVGPLISIVRHVQALERGDYSKDLKLRERDELHFLADELNKLTLKLREGAKKAKAN